MNSILIIEGDITTASVDAIVNAANPKMLGGGGVDGAIHKAAGRRLLDACRKIKPHNGIRCPVGEAKITPGFNLNAKYVIHTVGPKYGIDREPEKKLGSAYQKSLDLAILYQCDSIAFPAISCGSYGYPSVKAAEISITICKKKAYKNITIQFYLYNKELVEIWTAALNRINIV